MKPCKLLYEDGQWYEGTITGCEKDENVWKYKITFSDGESTYASRDDPEVEFHPSSNWNTNTYLFCHIYLKYIQFLSCTFKLYNYIDTIFIIHHYHLHISQYNLA